MSADLRMWLEICWAYQIQASSPSGFIGDPAAVLDPRQRPAGMTTLCSGNSI